jgi:hypothetical protein
MTRFRTSWLCRLVPGRRLDRNPLRRAYDRAETVALGVLIAGFLVAAPFAAHAAGNWAYAASAREAQAQRAGLSEVPATLLRVPSQADSYPGAAAVPPSADARWRALDGQVRTGELFVPSGATAGSTVPVWVNKAGRLADPPLSRSQLATRARLAAELAAGSLVIALAVAPWLTRRAFDRRRMAAWDADWLATAPRWSPRR